MVVFNLTYDILLCIQIIDKVTKEPRSENITYLAIRARIPRSYRIPGLFEKPEVTLGILKPMVYLGQT